MKRITLFVLLSMFIFSLPLDGWAQLKKNASQPNISDVLSNGNFGISGLLDPSRMQMHHSFSMSYGAFGGQGMMLSTYINSIDYRISKNLFLQTNLGFVSSPYNTLGEKFYLNKPQFIGSAQLTYRMNQNTSLMLRVERNPFGYYRPQYNNPMFWQEDPFRR